MSVDQKANAVAAAAKPRAAAPTAKVVEAAEPSPPTEDRGPMVSVTAKVSGLAGTRVVNAGDVYSIPERDAVEAIVHGMVERDGVRLTPRGQAYLLAGCKAPYTPPEPAVVEVIPTVKVVVLWCGDISGRVHSKGDVVDVAEDLVAWEIAREEKDRRFTLSPGEELSPRGLRLLAKLATDRFIGNREY